MKHNFSHLIVWQKSLKLAKNVYSITKGFPSDEKYGLTLQMKRSAVSIPSNIAEGASRTSSKEFLHFINIANGSCAELYTQIMIAKDVIDNLNKEHFDDLEVSIVEIKKMLFHLYQKIQMT